MSIEETNALRLLELQARLACIQAHAEISSNSHRHGEWWDTADIDPDDEVGRLAMAEAVEYLLLLNQLEKHPTHPAYIRLLTCDPSHRQIPLPKELL